MEREGQGKLTFFHFTPFLRGVYCKFHLQGRGSKFASVLYTSLLRQSCAPVIRISFLHIFLDSLVYLHTKVNSVEQTGRTTLTLVYLWAKLVLFTTLGLRFFPSNQRHALVVVDSVLYLC